MTSPSRSVLHLAWPIVLSFWMRQLFTFVDAWFARGIGDQAVAGIGLAFPYEMLMIAFWVGASTGMTSLLSRAMGAREGERFDQVVRVTRRVVGVIIPLFMLLGAAIWLRPRWFVASGVTDETLQQFRIYATVITAGTAFTGFWSIIPDSIVKAHHDTKATMWAGMWSNVVNVVLNVIFVVFLGWGMFGIAFSTVLGRLAALVYAMRAASRHERRRRGEGAGRPGLESRPYRAILRLAIPAAAAYVLMATEISIVNLVLARGERSTEALAAYSIYHRFYIFFVMPIMACGVALLPFVARAWGSRDVGTIRRAWRDVSLAGGAYVVAVVAPLTLLLNPQLAGMFTESPETAALVAWCLRWLPVACLVTIPFFACRPIFEGVQRGAPGMIMSVVRYGVLTWLVVLGAWAAVAEGRPALHGVVVALVVATSVASAAFWWWMSAFVGRLEREAAAPSA